MLNSLVNLRKRVSKLNDQISELGERDHEIVTKLIAVGERERIWKLKIMKPSKEQTAKTNSGQEEAAIQKRQEAYDKRYENMSPFKKKEELKSLCRS
ncbi:hypothetical protein LEP1GSC070_1788 [Leptospira santarosai str. AIM]|nr:hypothetical protein LEP1GSC070_1788 [Leptospira santarosai str. AIM]